MRMEVGGALSLFGAMILLTILAAQLLTNRALGKRSLAGCFWIMLGTGALIMLINGVLIFSRELMEPRLFSLVMNIDLAGVYVLQALYCRYLCILLEYCKTEKVVDRIAAGQIPDENCRRLLKAQYAACLVNLIVFFAGIIGDWTAISVRVVAAVSGAVVLSNLWSLFVNRQKIGRNYTIILMILTPLPITAGLLQEVTDGAPLAFQAITVTLLIMYIMIQTSQAKIMREIFRISEEKHLQLIARRMKPHFLYNSLSTIYYLCDQDPVMAQQAIGEFTSYLRDTMDAFESRDLVPFSWEREQIDHYMFLEKLRFGENVELRYELEAGDFLLPPLSVQLLVENAVKHGRDADHQRVEILVSTEQRQDGIQVRVSDNGRGFKAEILDQTKAESDGGRGHLGLATVEERIRLFCNGRMQVESEPGRGTQVTLFLPAKRS